jgi:hypothetical protein
LFGEGGYGGFNLVDDDVVRVGRRFDNGDLDGNWFWIDIEE